MKKNPKWAEGDRIRFTDAESGDISDGVVEYVKFEREALNTYHIYIVWDNNLEDFNWWHEADSRLTPVPNAEPTLNPIYNGRDLNALAPEIPLADKIRLAGQTSAFLHSTTTFMLNAMLRAMWETEKAQEK